MAQDTTASIVMYQGNGSTTQFPVPMTKGQYGTISVAFVRRSNGTYTYNPNTFSLNSSNTYLTWTGTTLQTGDYICIVRTTSRGQPYSLPNNQKHIESALDNLERQIQELQSAMDTALKVDPTYAIDPNMMSPSQMLDMLKNHVAARNNPHQVTKAQIGLGNVDNTSDLNKPISTATQAALDAKQNTISDLSTIRSGAAAGATAVQPGNNVSSLTNDAGYITKDVDNLTNYTKSSSLAPVATLGTLTSLNDTTITSPSTGQNLVYDSILGKWKNASTSATVGWGGITGDISDQTDLKNALDSKLNLDGTSIMTGPLKFIAGSFSGAIAGGLGDGIAVYKINSSGTIQSEVASLTLTNGFVPGSTNTINIGSNALKWKNLYLSGKAYVATINNGGDIDVPTKAGTMALESDIGRTNCITEIPQNVKIEFDESTKVLTLKAGSKLYVPNGSGVFDTITIDSDKTLTNSFSGQYNNIFVFWDTTANDFRQTPTVYSGTSDQTTTTNRIWYDTTANKIKYYANSGTTVTSDAVSFPICIMANAGSGNGFTKVMQEFQGIGYLGGSTFVLPGVKALLPNGRNADGTLKNTLLTFSNPTVSTTDWANNSRLGFLTSSGLLSYGVYNYYEQDTKPVFSGTYATWFDTKNNVIMGTADGGATWTQYQRIYVGTLYKAANANITEFVINEPFRAVNASDKTYPCVVHIKGTMIDSATVGSAISAAGAADIIMYANGQAVINFTLRFSAAGSSGDYTYGISADLISALAPQIPKITPVGGTCVYFDDTGVVAGDTGRAGVLDPVSGKYWRFGRVYQDDGTSGGWDASRFTAGWHVTGTLIGVFDK